jgi:cytochrome c oxidase subunit II
VLIGAVVGAAAAAVALFIPWLPPVASRERSRIDFVFWFTTVICIGIFALVASVILYSIVKFRRRPDDDSDGPPIHGHTGLEVVWTAVPAVLVTAISIASGVVLARNTHVPKDHLTVDVSGQQFLWSFKYPEYKGLTSGQLRLPLGRHVLLRISAVDVIHSFWVPEFGQKQDALPDQTNNLVITPDKLGRFPVICTELCGLGHPTMRTSAIVMEPKAFDAWVREAQRALRTGGTEAGRAVYGNNGCGGCHRFEPAGSTGAVGPDLDKLPEEAKRAGKPLEPFVRESIVDPNAYIEPGFNAGTMPTGFGKLPKDQLKALVKFLVKGAK